MSSAPSQASFDTAQRAILERIARGAALAEVLNDIVLLIEQQVPGLVASILLLDDERLKHGAAPNLPEDYIRAVDGELIGPTVGSCGTAAFTKQAVVVEDIATHPSWKDFRHFALAHGLRACWSTPIVSPAGTVLGTFALYYQQARGPSPAEFDLVDVATHLASIAIGRELTEQELRRSEARAQRLARVHAVSNSINQLIMRARDPQTLYDLACDAAVQKGFAKLAWLGLLDEAHEHIEIVAQCGARIIDTRVADLTVPENRGSLTARVIKSGMPVVANDVAAEALPQWRSVLLQQGLGSCALFPLQARERIYGVFTLYAQERNYFRDDELQVLTTLAADISYGIESMHRDLERQRMEETVRESESLRALIHSTVGDGIFYLQVEHGPRYRFLSVNRAFAELFGVTEETMIGRILNDALPEAMRDAVLERYRRASQTNSRVTWEQVVEARTGTKHVEITIAPIFDRDGHCTNFVGTVHDVTARVQAEIERTRLVAQLNQSQRMQALGTLAGGIAHDFNNILAAISGNAGLALEETGVEGATRTHLLEIQKASRRAIELVRQILTFSRHAPVKREVVDPVEVAREALNLLRATLPRSAALETQFAADTPSFLGDATQFHQIVMNLATNAAYALPQKGGLIQVKLTPIHFDESPASLPELSGDYVRLQVIDNGAGMDETALKRAFDPFFTTRPPGEGTGLGLSVVHGIVDSHHGAIEIHSRVGEGTRVDVYLPAEVSRVAAPAQAPTSRGRGERVMYVDDEEALVFLINRALTKMGYTVTGFSDPTEAIAAFRARPDEFDVVITDVSMPEVSGAELAVEVRRVREHVPIIMTSGYIRAQDMETAQRLGINQLVYKANTIEELGKALAKEIEAAAKGGASNAAASPGS